MEQPPPQYAAYPRQQVAYGSADRLEALGQGYFDLNKVFYLNVLLVIGSNAALRTLDGWETRRLMFVITVLVLGLVIAGCAYPQLKKIGYGANWSPSMPLVAAILMGLNSALCCGIIGFAVVQSIASKEMQNYGLKAGSFSAIKKADVAAAVATLRAQGASGPT
ncbi:MAG: hypothetical protein ACAH95_03340 [Fimbriimonas sp.]